MLLFVVYIRPEFPVDGIVYVVELQERLDLQEDSRKVLKVIFLVDRTMRFLCDVPFVRVER